MIDDLDGPDALRSLLAFPDRPIDGPFVDRVMLATEEEERFNSACRAVGQRWIHDAAALLALGGMFGAFLGVFGIRKLFEAQPSLLLTVSVAIAAMIVVLQPSPSGARRGLRFSG